MMAEEKKCKKEGKTGLDLSISRQTRQECLRDQPEEWVIRNRRACDAVADLQNHAVDFGRSNPLFCKVIEYDYIQAARHGREL